MLKTMIENFLLSMGVTEGLAGGFSQVVLVVLIALGAGVVYWVLRNHLLRLIHGFTLKTSNTWDDALMETGVFRRFLALVPLTLASLG